MSVKTVSKPWFDQPEPLPAQSHIAIIGAGISGYCAAYHLAAKGYQVTLIEKNTSLFSDDSANPAAIFAPFISSSKSLEGDFYFEAYNYALDFYNKLGPDVFHQSGLTKIAKDSTEDERFRKIANSSPREMVFYENGSLIFPKCGYLIPSQLPQKISKNINVLLNTEIIKIEYEQDSTWSIFNQENNILINADALVLCNSYFVENFKQTKHINLDKRAGQVSYIKPESDNISVLFSEAYLTPPVRTHAGNAHLLGATFEQNSDLIINESAHQDNLKRSPYQFQKPIILGGRRGIRAMSADHLPLVGPVPNYNDYEQAYDGLHNGPTHKKFPSAPYHKNLFTSVGLGARGFLSAPLLGKTLSSLISGTELPITEKIYHALHPARFIVRKLSKK